MKKSSLYLFLLLTILWSCRENHHDAIEAKKQEVLSLVNKAIEKYKSDGTSAFAKFSDKNNTEFVYEEYYVFVADRHEPYNNVAHINTPILGRSILETIDPDTGYEIGKVIVESALASPDGTWLKEYRYKDPADNQYRSKFSYVKIYGDYIFGSGYYKD